ncbi:roadblock/LC7 domain-containing protein [Longispora albida]|uniref:roadblock/LC7 domain-containing protein n=1 Tax=Longispora albida TaxID=203523 RepID=UPI00037246B1|nr:roadblock/LC7 domain-containing protein [Longispora albida]
MDVQNEAHKELRLLRERFRDAVGSSVASVDGLLIAHDARGVEPDLLAALSAAYLALGQQLAAALSGGEFVETVTRAANGYVGVYAAGQGALLTVLTGPQANIGLLHLEARATAARIGALVDRAHADRALGRIAAGK